MRRLTRASKFIEDMAAERRGETFKGLKLTMRKGGQKMATIQVKIHLSVYDMQKLIDAHRAFFGGPDSLKSLRDAAYWFAEGGILDAIQAQAITEEEDSNTGEDS